MMFYEAAGGRRYTGLWNDYQQFVDLSDLLRADRAILIAQGPAAEDEVPQGGATLLRDGNPLTSPRISIEKCIGLFFPSRKARNSKSKVLGLRT